MIAPATSSASSSSAMPIVRHGRAGAKEGRRAIVLMGIHLSGNVHAGRWRSGRGLGENVVEVFGELRARQLLERIGEPSVEPIEGSHCWPPPGELGLAAGIGLESGAKRDDCAMQPRLRRSQGDAE